MFDNSGREGGEIAISEVGSPDALMKQYVAGEYQNRIGRKPEDDMPPGMAGNLGDGSLQPGKRNRQTLPEEGVGRWTGYGNPIAGRQIGDRVGQFVGIGMADHNRRLRPTLTQRGNPGDMVRMPMREHECRWLEPFTLEQIHDCLGLKAGVNHEAARLTEPLATTDLVAGGLNARATLAGSDDSPTEAFAAWDQGDHDAAMEAIQAEVPGSDPDRRDLLRRVMVGWFTELGPESELASAHRRRLSSALS